MIVSYHISASAGVTGSANVSLFEGGFIEGEYKWQVIFTAACHQKRCFGQAISGEEGAATKTAAGKRFRELIECFTADRLGAKGRDLPVAQIKRCLLFSCKLADAQVIAKIWADADGSPGARNCLQPAIGALQKGKRRHHRRWIAAIHRKENAADQSHIVIGRQPCHHMAG